MQKLGINALIGLTVVVASFLSAVAAGNNSTDINSSDDYRACASIAGATLTSRDLEWDGSDSLGISVDGHAEYTRGSDDKVHVSGDPQLLAHLRVRKGNIKLDCIGGHFDTSTLIITLPGREFRAFGIAGHGNLNLHKLDQPKMNLAIAGSGSIKADGQVGHASIDMAGSGNVDLGRVTIQVAKVHIAGSGDVDIAPLYEASIQIVGSGSVNLHTKPERIETRILGSGRVRNVASGN